MKALIIVPVVIGALLVIASGVWVAVALVAMISANRTVPKSKSNDYNQAANS